MLLLAQQVLLPGDEDGEELLLLLAGHTVDAARLTVGGVVHSGVVENLRKGISDLHGVKRVTCERLDDYIVFKEDNGVTELTFGDVQECQ